MEFTPDHNFGEGQEAENRASDDAESAESPGSELGQIVTDDVLNDLAAAAGERGIGKRKRDANDGVAERAAIIGREHATEGGFFRSERIDREPLAVLRQCFLQFLNGASHFDSDGEVGPGVPP